MKKTLLSLLAMAASCTAYALPLATPTEASLHCESVYSHSCYPKYWDRSYCWCYAWSLRIGYYGDFVFDRHLRVRSNVAQGHIHRTSVHTNAGFVALNLWNLFDIFGILGGGQFHITSANSTLGAFTASSGFDFINIDTSSHFAWSAGVRGTLWQCGCLGIGAEAQYFQVRPAIRYVATEDFDTIYPPDLHVKYEEWQVGIGPSYRINIAGSSTALIPYAGIKWSSVRVDAKEATFPELTQLEAPTFFTLESEREVGWAIGLTLLGCNKTTLTVEGRFADEKALHVKGQFRY